MEQHYISVPGHGTHELPPLFIPSVTSFKEAGAKGNIIEQALDVVEGEDLVPGADETSEQRKFELAINFIEGYQRFVASWQLGDSILAWVQQCEITFESVDVLRSLLHPDVWPHAGRSSFVTLLREKSIPSAIPPEKAVGFRLTFREPPPINYLSDQFLMYLNATVADTAFQTWAGMCRESMALLPPDRFHFELVPVDATRLDR